MPLPFKLAQGGVEEGAERLERVGEVSGLGSPDLLGVIAYIVNLTLGFLGVIFLILIIVAGFRWMMSGGEEDKIKKAKATIVHATIGLVIVLASWAIAQFVFSLLGRATGADGGGGGI